MIGKKVQSDKGSHMVAGAIRNLSAYITNPNNGKEKCIASGGENFLCDDLTVRVVLSRLASCCPTDRYMARCSSFGKA